MMMCRLDKLKTTIEIETLTGNMQCLYFKIDDTSKLDSATTFMTLQQFNSMIVWVVATLGLYISKAVSAERISSIFNHERYNKPAISRW
jgi:hypothetical protein